MPDIPPSESALPTETGNTMTAINQSGGVNISGSVTVGGDVVGHDKVDNSITVSNVSGTGIAIGHGAVANVTIVQPPPPLIRSLHQIPPPPSDFTGREADLKELCETLRKDVTIYSMHGMGGIGKTTLTLRLAAELRSRYPDAQFYVDLQGTSPKPMRPADALAHIIRAYHPSSKLPDSEEDLRGLYCSVLDGQRAILLMDNAKDAAQVIPLIPPATCVLLVTSREHFALPGVQTKNLECLLPAEAEELLLKIAGRIGPWAAKIAALCGYLPLALRLAGSALAERLDLTPAEYVQKLQKDGTRLALVDTSLELSYALLAPMQQCWWRTLAVFSTDFDRDAAAAVWGLELEIAHDVLSDLLKLSLVEWDDQAGRYRLHDLARLFATTQLVDRERTLAEVRHSRHYLNVLDEVDKDLYSGGNALFIRGLAHYDAEYANIQAGQLWAATYASANDEAAELCSQYPATGSYCLFLRQHPQERIKWLEAALIAAQRLQDRKMEGVHLGNLGIAYKNLGEPHRAVEYHEQALAVLREIGNRRGEGATLGNLGLAYMDLADDDKEHHLRRAIELHEQNLVIAREIGDRHGEGNALMNTGNAYRCLGETRRAIEYHEQALAIFREIGDRSGEGTTLGSLGLAYGELSADDEEHRLHCAIEYYKQALVVLREIGDRQGEGTISWNLGTLYEEVGDLLRAVLGMQVLVEFEREIGHPNAERHAIRVDGIRARLE